MDHIYQQKLVNEKNELQRQVAKANKQIAQLSEQVKQYQIALATLQEAGEKQMMPRGQTDPHAALAKFKEAKYGKQLEAKPDPVQKDPPVNPMPSRPRPQINQPRVPKKPVLRGEGQTRNTLEEANLLKTVGRVVQAVGAKLSGGQTPAAKMAAVQKERVKKAAKRRWAKEPLNLDDPDPRTYGYGKMMSEPHGKDIQLNLDQ